MKFRVATMTLLAATGLRAQTTQPVVQQTVTVTATDRGLANVSDEASSVAVLTPSQLQQAPGLTLDDALHAVAGFQLFRRTSSWTANPTSAGVSLRGLGSTAASRTLVVSDQVPLTDPFGGWVHWNEVPALAVREVDVVRGASSTLYGSSAIAGAIDVVPRVAAPGLVMEMNAGGAQQSTGLGDLLLSGGSQTLSALGALSVLSTGGYVPTAPWLRGRIDSQSNVVSEAARTELRSAALTHTSLFLRGNMLNEARGNGTPAQTNGTRLWRYAAGGDWQQAQSTAALRLYGSREAYRQSFSSIASDRNSEALTKLQRVPLNELGLVAQASHAFAQSLFASLGFDVRDVRATDAETPVSVGVQGMTTAISARQRVMGGYADGIWQPKQWSVSASVRVDSFRTFNARSVTGVSAATALSQISELVASPRLGVVRKWGKNFSLSAAAFRAFRGPTFNELYRTGQVGQQLTLANNSLLAERATGIEAGGEYAHARYGRVRSTFFWTEVNRPVFAVLLSQTTTSQTLQRQNLGQIRSRGLMLEAQSATKHGVDASVSYQFAAATVTAFRTDSTAQPNLLGKWIPEVARNAFVGTVNARNAKLANLHVTASYQGKQFDDALNTLVLHPYARVDAEADRSLWRGLSMYAGAQNLLDRTIEAGRTPTLTLASPRLVRAGMRYTFSR
ncbi:TonB-dependent receptor [Granulicella cerasi]|uniref:TonB-dependent receptor n=1 Tax=Granulicella cerasi TaxID=741063 RepID=A0ABW1Z8F2_9BACT|nr:TonB-dependent receptor [Granulicella cerasi]